MIAYFNKRIKNLTFWDIALTKLSVLFATIVIVQLFPRLLEINIFLWIILSLLCAIRPLYAVWVKK